MTGTISPWMPERDPVGLAVLGKLAEEAAELASRAARCIIQGAHEHDPATGRTNLVELQREIADVQACIAVVCQTYPVEIDVARATEKAQGFSHWHDLIRRAEQAPVEAAGDEKLKQAQQFIANYFAPWGAWKSEWWEDISRQPLSDQAALKHLQSLLVEASA